MSISRMSQGDAQPPSCSARMRREGPPALQRDRQFDAVIVGHVSFPSGPYSRVGSEAPARLKFYRRKEIRTGRCNPVEGRRKRRASRARGG